MPETGRGEGGDGNRSWSGIDDHTKSASLNIFIAMILVIHNLPARIEKEEEEEEKTACSLCAVCSLSHVDRENRKDQPWQQHLRPGRPTQCLDPTKSFTKMQDKEKKKKERRGHKLIEQDTNLNGHSELYDWHATLSFV